MTEATIFVQKHKPKREERKSRKQPMYKCANCGAPLQSSYWQLGTARGIVYLCSHTCREVYECD